MIELGASEMMTPSIKGATSQNSEIYNEALAALAMLGFQKAASEKALKAIFKDSPDIAVEDAVRSALKRL
jgi:Holliday junction DNA helicase RuvA